MNFQTSIRRNHRKTAFFVLGIFIFFSFLLSLFVFAYFSNEQDESSSYHNESRIRQFLIEFVRPIYNLFFLDSTDERYLFVFTGVFYSIIISAVILLFLYLFSTNITLSVAKAKPANSSQSQYLQGIVEEMAIAAGIPCPKVYIINDPSANAFACGSEKQGYICFTTGILEVMNREELQGIAGHEVSHLKNGDSRLMTIVAGVGMAIGILAQIAYWLSWFSRRTINSGKSPKNAGGVVMLFFHLAMYLMYLFYAILAPILYALISAAVSRSRESLADDSSVDLTRNPNGLASALIKLQQLPTSVKSVSPNLNHLWIAQPEKNGTTNANLEQEINIARENSTVDVAAYQPIPEKTSHFDTHPSLTSRILHLKEILGFE